MTINSKTPAVWTPDPTYPGSGTVTWEGYSVYELRPGVWRAVLFNGKSEAKVIVRRASLEAARIECENHHRNTFRK